MRVSTTDLFQSGQLIFRLVLHPRGVKGSELEPRRIEENAAKVVLVERARFSAKQSSVFSKFVYRSLVEKIIAEKSALYIERK